MDSISVMAQMIKTAKDHADATSGDRLRAIEYYNGDMKDTPADVGRSTMVKRVVRAQIKKVLPSLMRTLLGASQLVEYLPIGPEDEEAAAQATDFVNQVVVPEAEVREAVESALHDALQLRNGIIRWWYDERKTVRVSRHTGLTDDAMAQLVSDDSVTVLEHSEAVEETDEGPILLHDLKVKRLVAKGKYCSAAVPRERFLIHPDAVDIEESPVVGELGRYTRSDIVAMGYDRDQVYALPVASDDDVESAARRDSATDQSEAARANEIIDYYDVYIRVDEDGDGISELRHVVFAGGLAEQNLLLNEECDEVQYCDVKIMSRPHQWEGISLADDLMDLQRASTVLLRQTLDNLYWQNNPQRTMQSGVIANPEAVLNPEFGGVIEVREGFDVRAALGTDVVPFVAEKSFAMLDYMDREGEERTGVSDASSGLAADALQNMTAKASAMIEQAGIGQTELMVSTAAVGLRKLYQGLLRLVIRHQDVPRTVRLRDEWVEFDPRQWNAEMDCSVNTGLGAGTRERDMIVMQQVIGLQEKLLAAFGPDNPFVKPENAFNAISKLVEASGLRSVSPYFTEPDPEEIQAKLEASQNQPSAEMMRAQAEMQMAQAKLQADMQMEQARMQVARDKERAQMEADLAVEQARQVSDEKSQRAKLEAEAILSAQKIGFEREKLAAEMQARREELAFQAQLAAIQAAGQQGAEQVQQFDQGQAFMALAQAMAAPKRIVRDENGEVVGVETIMN